MSESNTRPNIVRLAGWLNGWCQPTGEMHGFHNHSVWGGNPFLVGDDWAGHSTFAAPWLPALAEVVAAQDVPAARERLIAAMRFQCRSRQDDGQFAHIGFQIGERVNKGLVHTVVPAAALCEAVETAGDQLPDDLVAEVERVVREVLAASESIYGQGAQAGTVANQEYIRLAARLNHMDVFDHRDWDDRVRADLDYLAEHFHVAGLPDDASSGSLRSQKNPGAIEPAEYYGLIIAPLVRAARRFDAPGYLDQAKRLARHVIRNTWVDERGRRRVHRNWRRVDGRWTLVRQPMLIAGIGLTLDAIRQCAAAGSDADFADEAERFLEAMDATYARSQSPAGMLLSAAGWDREQDIIPSTAWQSHDLLYLLRRFGAPEAFDAALSDPEPRTAAILGHHSIWLEAGPHWALTGPVQLETGRLRGRKDRPRFELMRSPWVAGRQPDPDMVMPDMPAFLETDDRIVHTSGRDDLAVLNASGLPYQGPGEVVDA